MGVFSKTDILLPEGIDIEKWAVVACDQYTSQPEYWERVKSFVGDAPSTLNLVYPEAFLSEGDARIDSINRTMREYTERGLFATLKNSLIYVERTVNSGKLRRGIVGAIDLEEYDYSRGSKSAVRATEGTVLERIPPRVKIRENASLELPHAILLVNDSDGNIFRGIETGRTLYDFDLCEGGGHITGKLISGDAADDVIAKIDSYAEGAADGLAFAVGDGNHSLAAAKACWENIKKNLSAADAEKHPARYCLVEIENIHDDALEFEPIHRAVFDEKPEYVISELKKYYDTADTYEPGSQELICVHGDAEEKLYVKNPSSNLTVGTLQNFLDNKGFKTDYIHGDGVVRRLAKRENVTGFILPKPEKSALFETVIVDGALPRKTFSMGEANEKRFYLEARRVAMQ